MLIFQVLWVVMAYILGSIPFGVVIAKTFCKNRSTRGRQPFQRGQPMFRAFADCLTESLPWPVMFSGRIPGLRRILAFSRSFFISLAGLACVLGHVFLLHGFWGRKGRGHQHKSVFIPLAFLAPAWLLRPVHAGYLEKRLCIAWLSQPSGFSAHLF